MPIVDETIDQTPSQSAVSDAAIESPANLAARKAELADLRYDIILRARWEASDNVESERKTQLRDDLVQLRKLYAEKIDEIAMTIGVSQAMETQADVEKDVTVPRGTKLPGGLRQGKDRN